MSKIMAPTQAVGKCAHLHGFSNGFRRLSADDVLWKVHLTVYLDVRYFRRKNRMTANSVVKKSVTVFFHTNLLE